MEWFESTIHSKNYRREIKNHAHVKKVGTPQNFFFALIDELWKTWKIKILKKWKQLLEISSFFTCVPKTTTIWGAVPDIRSETMFCHFGPFFALHTPAPPPPNNSENQNFEKMKKASRDVITLNLCNKKINQMMYDYSDMESKTWFFVILGHWPKN